MNLIDTKEEYDKLVQSGISEIPEGTFISTQIFEKDKTRAIVLEGIYATSKDPTKIVKYRYSFGGVILIEAAKEIFDKSELEKVPVIIRVNGTEAQYISLGIGKNDYFLRTIGADKYEDPIFELPRILFNN